MFRELKCKVCGWIWEVFNPKKADFKCPCGSKDVELQPINLD